MYFHATTYAALRCMYAIDVRVYAAIIIQVNNSFGYCSAESSLIEKKKKELLRSSSSIEFSRWHSAVIFKNTQHNPIRFLIVSFGCVAINDNKGILGVFSHFISLFSQNLTGHSIKIFQKLKHTTKHPK